MVLSKEETRTQYCWLARYYDTALWGYRLLGARVGGYRRRAVERLALRPGDTVVDLGCGTGLNLPLLREAVGSEGHIIGVDLTDAMLDQGRDRVRRAGWQNVELVQADMAEYAFPSDVDGILSTFAITMVDAYDEVVARGAEALRPGGRMALLELKRPEGWPAWLVRLLVWLNKPFGVSLDYAERHPWESIRRHLREITYKEYYGGAVYVSVGEAE